MAVALKDDVAALAEAVRAGGAPVLPVAGASKPALSTPPRPDVMALDVSGLRGVVEYDPVELTFTARAGTPVAEVAGLLAEHEQHLPFDPPLAEAGATLGGVVAAGTSGPGALRHGGVRDFVIGVRFVDGTGTLVAGGGRVVKNAAGFDLPKLMVGSRGRLGIMVELSFKVFPRPRACTTLAFALGSTSVALEAVARLARGPMELQALDVAPGGRLLVRLAGDPEGLDARARRLAALVGPDEPPERLDGPPEAQLWRQAGSFAWAGEGTRIVRVGLVARDAEPLEAALRPFGATVRLSLAANVAWVAWPSEPALSELDGLLGALGLSGVALTGAPQQRLLGLVRGGAFASRLRAALDPDGRFLED